jgi:hypothetical protein
VSGTEEGSVLAVYVADRLRRERGAIGGDYMGGLFQEFDESHIKFLYGPDKDSRFFKFVQE